MNSVQNPPYQAGMEARFADRGAPQPDGADAARRGAGGRDPGDGRDRLRLGLQSVPHAAAEAAGRHRKPRRLRHQDHDGIAAYVRLHAGSAALRGLGQNRDPGSHRSGSRRSQDAARQGADGRPHHRSRSMPAPGCSTTKQQLLDLHKDIFLQSSTGYEARLSQALVDIGKSTVTSDEHVDVKLLNGTLTADRLQDHRRRRGGAVRRQCRDESGQSGSEDACRGA